MENSFQRLMLPRAFPILKCFTNCLLCLFLGFASISTAWASNNSPWVGLIIPMPSESKYLLKHLQDVKSQKMGTFQYKTAHYADQNIVLIHSDIGSANAARAAVWLNLTFHPKFIALLGSAGGINGALKVGDVVVGKRVFSADLGSLTRGGVVFKEAIPNPHNGLFNPYYFKLDSTFLKPMQELSKQEFDFILKLGVVASSDNLPNPPTQVALLKTNEVDVIAMEDASVLQMCWLDKIPCLTIRGVSNVAGNAQTSADTTTASTHGAKVFLKLLEYLKTA